MSMEFVSATCGECVYSKEIKPEHRAKLNQRSNVTINENHMRCVRYPPVPVFVGGKVLNFGALVTKKHHACGEYRSTEAEMKEKFGDIP